MSEPRRQRSRVLSFIVLLAVLLIPVSIVFVAQVRHDQDTRERELAQQTFLQKVRQLGGKFVQVPAGSTDTINPVIAVDLSKAVITGDVLDRLAEFTTIQRLNLDGATLERGDYLALGRLTTLRNLSLNESTFADDDLPLVGSNLTALSIRGTTITDEGLLRLSGMTSLKNLDISDTKVTSEGLKSLTALSSLTALAIDDDCITPGGVMALQSLQELQVLRVHVGKGLGRQTKDLLRPFAGSSVQGLHPSGHLLWDAAVAWDETLAGVVEGVADEVDLEPQQVTQLIEAIGEISLARQQSLLPAVARKRVSAPERKPIESVDEFLRRLCEPDNPASEVIVFACNSFTKEDVPKLLEKLRAEPNLGSNDLLCLYGAFLLVRHGMNNSDAVQELERMFNHEDSDVRGRTAYGFSGYGIPCQDRQPSAEAVAFGLPHLIRLASDPNVSVQLTANEMLGDVVRQHPDRASEVLPVLIDKLTAPQGGAGYVDWSLRTIAEVNSDAAIAAVPQLRRLLEDINKNTDLAGPWQRDRVLEVLFDVVRTDSELSHEAALEFIQAIRDGDRGTAHIYKLVSPGNVETVRLLVHELLDISAASDQAKAEHARNTLASVARAIRDYRAEQDTPP
jgi:hypothetical protein